MRKKPIQDQSNASGLECAFPAEPGAGPVPSSLFAVCAAMTSTLELDQLLDMILDLTLQELAAQRGSILLYDEESDTLKMLASRGMPEEVVKQGYLPRKGSIAEWVMANNEPQLLQDSVRDSRFSSISEQPLRSSICAPLRSKGRVIGTLNVTRLRGRQFAQDNVDSLMIMATQAAVSIENARLFRENAEKARLAAIGQTVSGISHCVKNMLTSLKGGMALGDLAIQQQDWRILQSGWQMLHRSVNRISLLVLDMLDYSKEREPVRKECDARELIEEAASVVQADAEKRHVTLVRDLPPEAGKVRIDSDQVFRCVLNLLTNALDAVEDDTGRVEVGLKMLAPTDPAMPPASDKIQGPQGAFVMWVRDNGCGIPIENQKDLFKPFHSTKGSKGTGLGLAVTRKIVHEHGGRVELESAPGQGSCFRLVIPYPLTETR